MTSKLTLVFDNDEQREDWIGWYLDGGGDQSYDMPYEYDPKKGYHTADLNYETRDEIRIEHKTDE